MKRYPSITKETIWTGLYLIDFYAEIHSRLNMLNSAWFWIVYLQNRDLSTFDTQQFSWIPPAEPWCLWPVTWADPLVKLHWFRSAEDQLLSLHICVVLVMQPWREEEIRYLEIRWIIQTWILLLIFFLLPISSLLPVAGACEVQNMLRQQRSSIW